MGVVVGREPCEKCGSSDNLVRYDDGGAHCFTPSCGYHEHADGKERKPVTKHVKEWTPIEGEPVALAGRCLTLDTCTKWGYTSGTHNGNQVQIANYRDAEGTLVGQKLRFKGKKFSVNGTISETLYGRHLWPDGGRMIVITEGEIDALSMSQVQGNKWPVVSLPNGSASARKAISANIEWLSKFDSVVLMFDMDEAGRAAVEEARDVLPPGRVKVASLPLKDPNEMLKAGRVEELIQAMWQAKTYRPDGIVSVADVMERALAPVEVGLPWAFPTLTAATYGRRYGEVYTIGAGTGIGKTDFLVQQVAYDIQNGIKPGVLFLEQDAGETVLRVAGKIDQSAYHVPDAVWTHKQRKAAVEGLDGKMLLYDSWGGTEWDVIKSKIRYMAVAEDVRVIYLDHLTALADTSNERESLEGIMKELAGMAHELKLVVVLVSHLSTPEGKPHEEGGRVMIRHFKGSRAIGFWSHFMFGLERNSQAADEDERGLTTFRVLKDRKTGRSTGTTMFLRYDPDTTLMSECEGPAEKPTDDNDFN